MKSPFILTVDPGIYTMGACLFVQKDFINPFTLALPIKTLCVNYTQKQRKETTQHQAISYMMDQLVKWFDKFIIEETWCERPRLFSGSAVSHTAASQGYLQGMDMFRGALFQLCTQYDCKYSDVDVLEWKGQLPKQLVIDRIKQKIGKEACMRLSQGALDKGHDWDACGIGLYLQGEFD